MENKNLIIFILLFFLYSCTDRNGLENKDISQDSLYVVTPNKRYLDKCTGNEYVFNKYLLSKFDRKKYHYINPYFSNEVFSSYLKERQYSYNDNIVAFSMCNKYFEILSIYMFQASNIKRTRKLVREYFDVELYEKLNIERDTISERISKLYEVK